MPFWARGSKKLVVLITISIFRSNSFLNQLTNYAASVPSHRKMEFFPHSGGPIPTGHTPLPTPKKKQKKQPSRLNNWLPTFNNSLLKGLKWRNIGPFGGGRSIACHGVKGQPYTYYFGADGRRSMENPRRGQQLVFKFGFHLQSQRRLVPLRWLLPIANVVYTGTGETDIRGNISYGDGMYKSDRCG